MVALRREFAEFFPHVADVLGDVRARAALDEVLVRKLGPSTADEILCAFDMALDPDPDEDLAGASRMKS